MPHNCTGAHKGDWTLPRICLVKLTDTSQHQLPSSHTFAHAPMHTVMPRAIVLACISPLAIMSTD